MDFKIGDRVWVCFPEDMRPFREDSVHALLEGRTGTIVHCVSGFLGRAVRPADRGRPRQSR